MKDNLKTKLKIKYLPLLLICFLLIRCKDTSEVFKLGLANENPIENVSNASHEEIAVSPPPFSDGIFPCNDCHAYAKTQFGKKNARVA